MHSDCGINLQRLQVDGGMSSNNLLLQMQADVLGIPVVRPSMVETTGKWEQRPSFDFFFSSDKLSLRRYFFVLPNY